MSRPDRRLARMAEKEEGFVAGASTLAMAGAPLDTARLAVIALHGKAGGQLKMVRKIQRVAPRDVAILAPGAASGQGWWPQPFDMPVGADDPRLAGALDALERLVLYVVTSGIPVERIVLVGFSQGASLALEHAVRTGRDYRAVLALSGAFLRTAVDFEDEECERTILASDRRCDGLDVYLSIHATDPHIPLPPVRASADILRALEARVSLYVAPEDGHGIKTEDLKRLRRIVARPLNAMTPVTMVGDVAARGVAFVHDVTQPKPRDLKRLEKGKSLRKQKKTTSPAEDAEGAEDAEPDADALPDESTTGTDGEKTKKPFKKAAKKLIRRPAKKALRALALMALERRHARTKRLEATRVDPPLTPDPPEG